MVGFLIEVNGKRHCMAGLSEGVINAFVVHANLPPDPPARRPNATPPTTLSVTGITSQHQSVHWKGLRREVHLGDVITIRLVDTDEPDPPTPTPVLPDVATKPVP